MSNSGKLADGLRDLAIGHLHFAGAVGVHVETDRLCHTDGIGHLHEHFITNTGSDQVLGHVAGSIRRTAVHFAGVLAAEGTTTVRTFATVGVHDDLATGQAGIAVRSADHERAGRVDVVLDVLAEEGLRTLGQLASSHVE